MLLRYTLVPIISLLIADAASGQTVARAYADNDGKAHVVFANGADKTIKPQPEQVGCADVSVADDGSTVGWSVLVENCCTSYPIPTSIVVYKDGHQHVIAPGQMIWKWRFIERGSQIAVLSGPVHGSASEARLYDWHGKQLASWDGSHAPPAWAKNWQQEFQP
jgi:hypothetical protein